MNLTIPIPTTKINMKIAIIDIGSNSVRKQVFSDGKILLQQVITCQLSLGIKNKKLAYESINRTFDALDKLILCEKQNPKTQIFAFATACVRNSVNGADFVSQFFNRYGVQLEVLSGEREAETGMLGALAGGDGSVIDVGGASSEIATASNGKIVYAHSMQDGAVTLTDLFKKDRESAENYLNKVNAEFEGLKIENNVYAIGGTANTLAFIGVGLDVYDPEKTEGYVLTVEELEKRVSRFYELSPSEIVERFKIDEKRANVIHSGALILLTLLKRANVKRVVLTERDNIYGYYLMKTKGLSYEK